MGKDETVRFMNVALYQGAPAKRGVTTLVGCMGLPTDAGLTDVFHRPWPLPRILSWLTRPLVIRPSSVQATRNRGFTCSHALSRSMSSSFPLRARILMLFSSCRDSKVTDRDIFNEKPTREEQSIATASVVGKGGPSPHASSAVIHTTVGDIHLRLFPKNAPKAVENFVGHARSGYYEGVIFHRVIPKFMIQTGDPLGDGTGGMSIWGRDFEDEFSDELRHDRCVAMEVFGVYVSHRSFCRPYTVSMANAGPNTNGSQFFITTTATPWLDKKHTIFGRVFSGLEVVHGIENVRVNKVDKPLEDIKIVNIDVD